MAYLEKQVESEMRFRGRVVNVREDKARLHTGKLVLREVVEHSGGVAVIPVDADGNVYTVRQFRYPLGRELVEVPAGKLEKGEEHYACAVRELKEETGLTAGKLTYLGEIYPSPGYCEEILHIYLATELTQDTAELDEDEFLDVIKMPLSELIGKIMSGEISDAKTIIAALKAEKLLKDAQPSGC